MIKKVQQYTFSLETAPSSRSVQNSSNKKSPKQTVTIALKKMSQAGDGDLADAAACIDSAANAASAKDTEKPTAATSKDDNEEEKGEEAATDANDDEEVKGPPAKRQKTGEGTEAAGKEPEAAEEEEKGDDEMAAEEDEEELTTTVGGMKQIKEKRPFTDEEAESTVAEYMENQNRPYSVQDLLNTFQH